MKLLLTITLIFAACALEVRAQSTDRIKVLAHLGTSSEWKEYPSITLESLIGFDLTQASDAASKFGGTTQTRVKKRGFFYTTKIKERWWLVDPDGYLFLNRGVNSVTPGRSKNNITALKERFQTEENWAAHTARLLVDNGFNGSGAWSKNDLLRKAPTKLPYAMIWNFMSEYGRKRNAVTQGSGHADYPNDAIFVFDPDFETFCNDYAKKLIPTKDDPYLIGHFSDNELPFRENALDNYLGLKESEPGYSAAVNWLAARRKTKLLISDTDRRDFLEFVAETYFRITAKAIRKYDANHLLLGSRFHGRVLNYEPVFKAAGKYVDIISINYYNRWSPEKERMAAWAKWAGRPFLVTEFYARAMDSGLPNTTGAGWTVKTQKDRGVFYENFTLGLLESKDCVGWHWFKYLDNDPDDITVDPSNRTSNKGVVTMKYEEYRTLLRSMFEINSRAYSLIDYFDGPKNAQLSEVQKGL